MPKSVKKIADNLKLFFANVDISLLIFLIFILNVQVIVKILGLLVVLFLNFKSHRINLKNFYFSTFYFTLIVLAFINLILNKGYSSINQTVAFGVGIFFWVFCLLAIWQSKSIVEAVRIEKIHTTLFCFFLINVIFSFGNLFLIIIETGALNPYQFQGLNQKYFINTGDYIKGITFDTSTTNSIISLFGFIYFHKRKLFFMSISCLVIILLTGSNLTLLITLCIIIYLFLFQSNLFQKSIIISGIFLIIIFVVKISPQNNDYAISAVKEFAGFKQVKNDSNNVNASLTEFDEETIKINFARRYLDSVATIEYIQDSINQIQVAEQTTLKKLPSPGSIFPTWDVHSTDHQFIPDTNSFQNDLIEFNQEHPEINEVLTDTQLYIPGKIIAAQQTFHFGYNNPFRLITGNGMGNFSSKLAFRSTGLNIAGGYPSRYIYINDEFLKNHLAVYLSFFTRNASYHSVINTPNSTYLQLFGEYGILGLTAFFFFYVASFYRKFSWRSFGIPLLLALLASFILEYWYEQLSIVLLFEILAFLCIKEQKLNVE